MVYVLLGCIIIVLIITITFSYYILGGEIKMLREEKENLMLQHTTLEVDVLTIKRHLNRTKELVKTQESIITELNAKRTLLELECNQYRNSFNHS